jgi:hypothetical protein
MRPFVCHALVHSSTNIIYYHRATQRRWAPKAARVVAHRHREAALRGCLSTTAMQFSSVSHYSSFIVSSPSSPRPRGPLARSTSQIPSG